MKKNLTTVAFAGTKEQEEKLDALIAKYKDSKGALMPILQGAQGIYGYLPIEVQKHIALAMDVSLAEVYGVHFFTFPFRFSGRLRYRPLKEKSFVGSKEF